MASDSHATKARHHPFSRQSRDKTGPLISLLWLAGWLAAKNGTRTIILGWHLILRPQSHRDVSFSLEVGGVCAPQILSILLYLIFLRWSTAISLWSRREWHALFFAVFWIVYHNKKEQLSCWGKKNLLQDNIFFCLYVWSATQKSKPALE